MASELTLIDRILGGDRDAFADLISGYLGLVHGTILNKVRRPDEVEDLVQDVFVKAYQELPNLRERDKFGAWLRRIALESGAGVAASAPVTSHDGDGRSKVARKGRP